MDFRNRGISSEDFEVADHFKDRRLTFSEPDRHLGQTRTETFVDVFAQFNEKLFSSFSLLKVKTSATGIRLAPEPRPVTYRPKDLPRDLKNPLHHILTPRDLTLRYWWLSNLDKAEEARLVGLAQSGDRRAFAELFKHFHKFILGVAGKRMRGRPAGNWRKQTDGLFEDLIAAGCVGFCEGTTALAPWHTIALLAPSATRPWRLESAASNLKLTDIGRYFGVRKDRSLNRSRNLRGRRRKSMLGAGAKATPMIQGRALVTTFGAAMPRIKLIRNLRPRSMAR
jgi:hypothetical protein